MGVGTMEDIFSNGILASVFRISRLAGGAPFTLTKNGPVISRCLTLYGYMVVTFINVAVVTGFVIDVQTAPSLALRTSTPTSCIVWIANFTIVTMIASAGVYRGPSLFSCNVDTMKQIIKIKMFIGVKTKADSEKKIRVSVISISCGLCFLIVTDLFTCVIEAIYSDKNVITMIMYSLLYYEYILILLIETQFVLLAWQLRFTLQSINKNLQKKIQNALLYNSKSYNTFLHPSDMTGITNLNNYVLNQNNTPLYQKSKLSSTYARNFPAEHKGSGPDVISNKSIRDFALAYGLVCDVLRQLNDEYGLMLLLIILSFFLQLIITPYYMIITRFNSVDWRTNIVYQFLWCIFHICDMVFVVEPCHRTQEEMEQTRILACLMLRSASPTNSVMLAELDLLLKQIMLNRPSYSPLGMCTISRPLIVAIIGAVTTYLVIVFQFRAFEIHLKTE